MYYFKVHKKSIEKIISQNAQIDSKLKKLIVGQKRLEQHITNLEKSININKNTNIDPAYIMVINILSYVLDVNLCKLTLTFNLLRGTLKKLLESYLRIQYTQHKVNLEK